MKYLELIFGFLTHLATLLLPRKAGAGARATHVAPVVTDQPDRSVATDAAGRDHPHPAGDPPVSAGKPAADYLGLSGYTLILTGAACTLYRLFSGI